MTAIETLPEKLNTAEKRQRGRYIAEARTAIEKGDRAYAELGAALWALQDEALYRDGGLTFPEFVHAEFGISKSNAYRCIEIAKAVQAHPELPIPSQYAIEQARPKPANRPKVGTVGGRQSPSDLPIPEVVDAEWSEEVEPKALSAPAAVASEPRDMRAPDSPGATFGGQSEMQAGLTAPGGKDNGVSTHARAVENATDSVECPGDGCPGCASCWSTDDAPTDQPQPTEKAWVCGTCGGGITTHTPGCQWEASFLRLQEGASPAKPLVIQEPNGVPISPATALLDLLTSADLDAIGTEMTADQMDTLTRAYERIRESWTVTHKARKDWSKELRARRPVESAPVASRSSAPLGRREVTPMFKQGKERLAR